MAKQFLYSVRDNKTAAYHRPFCSEHKNLAVRSFRTAVNDAGTELNKYPEDFELFEVGEFEVETGMLKQFTAPVFICSAMSLLDEKNQPALNPLPKSEGTYHGE